MSSRHFTSWNTKDCYAEYVLKTLSRSVLKKSSRCLGNQKNIRLKSIRLIQSFTEPFELYNGNAKAELDLLNYILKVDLKGGTGTNTSTLASKADLTSLKTKRDNSNLDEFNTVPVDLGKISNVVNNHSI